MPGPELSRLQSASSFPNSALLALIHPRQSPTVLYALPSQAHLCVRRNSTAQRLSSLFTVYRFRVD